MRDINAHIRARSLVLLGMTHRAVMEKFPVYKTEGIILKSADLGQLDRLLTIYTLGYGKILARAISVRKKESKLRGYLEPFTHAKFLLAKSRTIDIVTDVEAIGSFSCLHKNLESLAYAYYFSELIDKLVVAPERDDKIWALLKRAMEVLNFPSPQMRGGVGWGDENKTAPPPAPTQLRRGGQGLNKIRTLFEQKLLEFLGHGIPKNKKALEIIQGLAGEEIKAKKFLEMAR